MKTIKCESFNPRNGYLDYFINGSYFWAQGEFNYVTALIRGKYLTRYEHLHEGKKGGLYMIVTKWE